MKFKSTLILAFAACVFMMSTTAIADWQPKKPINLWIAFGAGAPTDALGRGIAAELEKQNDWQVISTNKPAGGGVALMSQLANAPKDGSTIGIAVNMPILINLFKRGDKLPFNLDSFDYLGSAVTAEKAIIAASDAPFSTIPELIEHAKTNGMVMAAAPGPEQFVFKALNDAADGKIRKLASEGSASSMTFLLGKQADVGFGGGTHLPYLEKGDIKVIAGINEERLTYAPDKQTLIEAGIELSIDPLFILVGPAGMDSDAREALTKALDKAIHADSTRAIITKIFKRDPVNLGPEGTKQQLVDGLVKVEKIFK